MRRYWVANIYCVALFIAIPISVASIPVWRKANSDDVNGHICPLPTYFEYPCPQLCVRNISQCPESLRPRCGDGQVYCVDGTCRSSCPATAKSKCACPGAPALVGDVYACLPGLQADIPNFVVTNKTAQQMESCDNKLGMRNVPAWNTNPVTVMWNVCPTPDYGDLTFTEPIYIALYAFYGSCIVMLSGWILYKKAKERFFVSRAKVAECESNVHQNDESWIPQDLAPSVHSDEKESKVPGTEKGNQGSVATASEKKIPLIKAYKRNTLGTVCFIIYLLQTIGMVAFMVIITNDYYQDFVLFRGSLLAESSTFIGMWYILFIWFASISIFKSRILNFFRIRCSYYEADYVQIEKKASYTVISQSESQKLTAMVRWLENNAKRIVGMDVIVTTAPVETAKNGCRYFVYQCTRYVYHSKTNRFTPHTFKIGSTFRELALLKGGLSTDTASKRRDLIGNNCIYVHVPNFAMAMLNEFSSFFYIYQFTILWIFYYYAYWQIGLSDTVVILFCAVIKVVVRIRSEHRVKAMAEYEDHVFVCRDGEWNEISSKELVPGDVYQVDPGKTVVCDCVLLSGNVVVDESSLTGEPLPIRKVPIRENDDLPYDRLSNGKISTLFCGTTVSQALPSEPEGRVCALVTHTGTATDKGQLIQNILFPSPVSFVFNEQIKIVILILLCLGACVLGLAIWLYAKGTSVWMYSMSAISQLLSPLLPASLVVGQSVAAGRLRSKMIFCVDLPRILMAGKVQLFCFDKTGTLTKEGLEFYGTQPVSDTAIADRQEKIDKDPEFEAFREAATDTPKLMQLGMATCHAVTHLDGQMIGNPVDIEMFRASGWQLEQRTSEDYLDTLIPPRPENNQHKIHVLKRFEFVHARMSMSVAVLEAKTNAVHIFVKGAYEKIKELSNPSSIPSNYDKTASELASYGCYVLALAHRQIDLEAIGGISAFHTWTRDQMEQQVDFIGLIAFKNQLKPDTSENIAELKRGATRTIMITGDTALTGVYIARMCGMALPSSRIFLGDVIRNQLVWSDVDDPYTFSDVNVDEYLRNSDKTPVELAVTGKAFEYLVRQGLIRHYLLNIRVFARMTPKGKVECVQLHMERGITAMTGDGGNDCGALRAAHVGIAMSNAEASIVSPFSTSIRSVASCVELIRQGRSALATSITAYKYLIMYGQVMIMLKLFTFYFSVAISQTLWISVDLFITVFLTWAVTQSKAAPRLEPHRPTARLLGPQTLASCLGLVAMNWLILSGAFHMLFQQDWFRCHEFDSLAVDTSKWWLLADSYEGEVLAIVCLCMFINNATVFNFGYKFRQSFWRNYTLVILWIGYLAIVSYVALADPNALGCLFRVNCGTPSILQRFGYTPPAIEVEQYNTPLGHNVMPREFRWRLWGICMGGVVASLLYERFVILGPLRTYLAKRYPLERLKVTL